MRESLVRSRSTHVCTTPAVWSSLLDGAGPRDFPCLEVVSLGGESLPPDLVRKWAPPHDYSKAEWVAATGDTEDITTAVGIVGGDAYQGAGSGSARGGEEGKVCNRASRGDVTTRSLERDPEVPKLLNTFGVTEATVYQTVHAVRKDSPCAAATAAAAAAAAATTAGSVGTRGIGKENSVRAATPQQSPSRPEQGACVGRPLSGVVVAVLKENSFEPAAPGEVGEIVVGGVQVTRGYVEDRSTCSTGGGGDFCNEGDGMSMGNDGEGQAEAYTGVVDAGEETKETKDTHSSHDGGQCGGSGAETSPFVVVPEHVSGHAYVTARREMATLRLEVFAFACIVSWYYPLLSVSRLSMHPFQFTSFTPFRFFLSFSCSSIRIFVSWLIQVPQGPRREAAHLPHRGLRCHRRRLGVYIIPRAAGHAGQGQGRARGAGGDRGGAEGM
jgi:acyl-CoA synthetase (AMP-forming)/AMP-acid ligase II